MSYKKIVNECVELYSSIQDKDEALEKIMAFITEELSKATRRTIKKQIIDPLSSKNIKVDEIGLWNELRER